MLIAVAFACVISACSGTTSALTPSPLANSAAQPLQVRRAATLGWQQALWSDSFVSSIGVNTHFSYTGSLYDSTRAETSLKNLGIRYIRDDGPNSTQSGHFAHLTAYGIHFDIIWPISAYVPPVANWAPTPDAYATQIGLSNIASYEGTNESNAGCTNNASWVSETKAQQSALFTYMQANGLESIPLLAPSYGACNGLANMIGDATAMGSLTTYANDGNLHSYPGTNHYPEAGCLTSAQSANCSGSYWLQASNIENPNQPVMVTETGYESQNGGCQWNAGTVGQERYDLRELLNNWNNGIAKTYLFELLDVHSIDGCYLGLVNDSYSAKPAYTAIQNLIATLADQGSTFSAGAMQYALGGSLTNVNNFLLQKHTGIFELVIWQAVPSINSSGSPLTIKPQTITLTFPSAPVSVTAQTFTNTGSLASVKVTTKTAVSSLSVTDIPTIVTINL